MQTVYRTMAALLLAGLGTLILGVSPASAAPDPFGCETAPVAEAPTDGLGGWLLPAPKNPPKEIIPTSGTSLLQNYGVAGLSWFSFDDDCDFGAGGVTDKPAEVMNGIASTVFLPAVLSAGATVSAGNAFGNPDWLDFLNPVLEQTSTALAGAFTKPLMPMFILLAGLSALIFAARRQVSQTLRVLAFVLIGFCVVGLTIGWPIKAATATDETMSAIVLTGQQAIINGEDRPPSRADREQPGAAFVGPLYKALVWDVWLRGQLGSDDSAVAQKYGYQLYASRTLTYAQKRAADRDPSGVGKEIYEQKKEDFKEVAAKIKEEDPGAYHTLTNANFGQRMGLAIGGSLVAPIAFSLPFLAFVLLLLCFLYWRFTVILGPMLGAVMVMMPAVARSVARKLGAVLINTVVFGLGAAVYIALARFITQADQVPFGWQCLAVAVLTLVGWVVLHPVRALTRFTSLNLPGPDGSTATGAVSAAKRVLTVATGTALGNSVADEDDEEDEETTGRERKRATHQWAGPAYTERDRSPEAGLPDAAEEPRLDVEPSTPSTSGPVTQEEPSHRELADKPSGTGAAPVVIIEDSSGDLGEQGAAVQPVPAEPIPVRYDDGAAMQDAFANPDEAGWVYYDATTKSFVSSDGRVEVEGGRVS